MAPARNTDDLPADMEVGEAATVGATPGRVILSIQEIAAANDIEIEWIAIPEWAPSPDKADETGFYIRPMSGAERADWQSASIVGTGNNTQVNFRATTVKAIILCAVDERGRRLFTDSDAKILLRKNSQALDRVSDRIMAISGIGDEEQALMGKGLKTTPDDSYSD